MACTQSNRFDADRLVEAALRRARRPKFSDLSFLGPLKRLLGALDGEAELSAFGRRAARFDVMRCLDNLLRFDAAEDDDPAIRFRPIPAPLFITGLPRASTTFLHQLLAQDPGNAVPLSWQLIYPYPARALSIGRDWRRDWVELQFGIFQTLSPGIARLHPLHADTPQECTDITAQVFQSLRFDTTYAVPSYQRWLDGHGHDDAFRFHRRFLQHLDVQKSGRWVLKSPDNLFALDAIHKVYPDAKIVFLHRDPLSVVASCAKLTELLRRPFRRVLDRTAIGRSVAERLAQSADRMTANALTPDILHLHFRNVISAPLETAELLYRHWGRPLSSDARSRMQAWLARLPPPGKHRYDLAEFGLETGALRERFAGYTAAYAIACEGRA